MKNIARFRHNCIARCTKLQQLRTKMITNPSLRDYEYSHLIEETLKNDVRGAYNLIVQSYLNKVVLDAQIYDRVFKRIKDCKELDITFHDILYRMYREHFHPMPIIMGLFQTLYRSNDPDIKLSLAKDINYMKINPIEQDEQPKSAKVMAEPKRSEEIFVANREDTQSFKKALTEGISNYETIVFHDVEMHFDKPQMNLESEEQSQQEEDEEQYMGQEISHEQIVIDQMMALASNIKHIRFGRIEVHRKKPQ